MSQATSPQQPGSPHPGPPYSGWPYPGAAVLNWKSGCGAPPISGCGVSITSGTTSEAAGPLVYLVRRQWGRDAMPKFEKGLHCEVGQEAGRTR